MRKSKKNSKPIVIIIGPPGSGKGTQAILLADKLGIYYFETSKVIEGKVMEAKPGDYQIIQGRKYSLLQEKKNWEAGKLCSPPLVTYWVKEEIKELAAQGKGIVFAGSPRTLYEAREIIPLLEKLYKKENIRVIQFTLSAKNSIWRNSHRRICELMRHPILYNKETQHLKNCPLDGSRLIKRGSLDDFQTIKVRLREYKKRTLPMMDYFQERGLPIYKLSAAPSPSVIFYRILKVIISKN